MMANEHWYVLIVRPGFETVVAHKLRKLGLEVLIPDKKAAKSFQPAFFESSLRETAPNSYLYCRFALENRVSVTSVPGVLDILGTPDPISFDEPLATSHNIECQTEDGV
jgi:hypothetical protein